MTNKTPVSTTVLSDEQKCAKCADLARLLIECRDALPAINLASARLHGVRLDLADRIEQALEPWRAADDDPNAI